MQPIQNISQANALTLTSAMERALAKNIRDGINEQRAAVAKAAYAGRPIAEDSADGDDDQGEDNESDTDPDKENLGIPDDADEECLHLILALTGLDPEQHKKKAA